MKFTHKVVKMGLHESLISVLGWKISLESLKNALELGEVSPSSKILDQLQDGELPEYDYVLATIGGFEFTMFTTRSSYMTQDVFSYFGVNYSDGTEATIPYSHITNFNHLHIDFPEEWNDIHNFITKMFGSYVSPSIHSLAYMS